MLQATVALENYGRAAVARFLPTLKVSTRRNAGKFGAVPARVSIAAERLPASITRRFVCLNFRL
jgi:hypothetical protein